MNLEPEIKARRTFVVWTVLAVYRFQTVSTLTLSSDTSDSATGKWPYAHIYLTFLFYAY